MFHYNAVDYSGVLADGKCPQEGRVLPMVRRCSRWRMVTISYQTRICGTLYDPKALQIQEFNTVAYRLMSGRTNCVSSGRPRHGMTSFLMSLENLKVGGKATTVV